MNNMRCVWYLTIIIKINIDLQSQEIATAVVFTRRSKRPEHSSWSYILWSSICSFVNEFAA